MVKTAENNSIVNTEELKERVKAALKTIYDPEIPVNIFDLGLIYDIHVLPLNHVHIRMTLTSPSCPAAEQIPGEVRKKTEETEGVKSVEVELVFDPPYNQDMMSEEAKLELGFL